MADFVFNIALGEVNKRVADAGANLGLLLLKAAQADADLRDYDNINDLLANAGNTECDFTNYARKTGITGTAGAPDDTNNRKESDIPDQTFTDAGGASNNNIVKAIVFHQDGAGDANAVPLTGQDFVLTTNGTTFNVVVNASGFYRASG